MEENKTTPAPEAPKPPRKTLADIGYRSRLAVSGMYMEVWRFICAATGHHEGSVPIACAAARSLADMKDHGGIGVAEMTELAAGFQSDESQLRPVARMVLAGVSGFTSDLLGALRYFDNGNGPFRFPETADTLLKLLLDYARIKGELK